MNSNRCRGNALVNISASCVRSSVKLLPEIKGLLSVKPNRERLYMDTVFGPWLDITSHDNDSHMMHYATSDEDTVRLCPLIASELVFMGKEKRNFLMKHLKWLVDDFDAWNAFPWDMDFGELPNSKKWWSKKANVIPHGLAWSNVKKFEKSDYYCILGSLSNPNVALISSPEEMRHAWFMATIGYIKGLVDQDGNFFQDNEARVNCIEHNNEMFGDTEVSTFVQDEEARVNGIEHHNEMCGDTEVDKFVQDEEARVNVEEGDGVLDSEGDGVHLSQTNDVIQQAVNLSTMSSTSPQAINQNQSTDFNPKKSKDMPNFCFNHNDTSNHIGGSSTKAKASSSSSNLGNDKDASYLDDLMEIDGENVKDGYTNSQDHLHLLIKALESKIENPTLDVVVDNYEDDYMLLLNDEEKPIKSSLNDIELKKEPDKIDKPRLGRGVGPLKVKKKNCQRDLRPNYLLRSAKDRKKKLALAPKPPFGQQSATTPVPKKRKSKFMKIEVNVPPLDLEDILGQPRIRSMNDIMTHEPFVEHLDLWIDLMWSLRPPEADWAIVSPHFATCILSKMMLVYFSNGYMYHLPWKAVEKVYFSVNEPKTHWCLVELKIRTGVVTFYDSLCWSGGCRRR
uniref:Phospholipase-like protein n=1 Tax=Tanacetum cinerariifolium TaxID=118510 RepID=A0A6L2NU75_TANCI|nr:phospholipase-like protein [Tanacetum cinerariifolium]